MKSYPKKGASSRNLVYVKAWVDELCRVDDVVPNVALSRVNIGCDKTIGI